MTKNKLVKELNKFYAALTTEDSTYHNCYVTKKDLERRDHIAEILYDLKENYFTHEGASVLYREVKNCHKPIKKETKIKIRKVISFIRTFFLALFVLCIFLMIASVEGPSLLFPIICFIIGMLFFGIAYFLDWLLWDTSFDNQSPFTH